MYSWIKPGLGFARGEQQDSVFIHYSSRNMHIGCQTGHKPNEYQNHGEKPYVCNVFGELSVFSSGFEKHERSHDRKPVGVRNVVKPLVCHRPFRYMREHPGRETQS